MSNSAGAAVQTVTQPRRRIQPRLPMRSLAYVRLKEANGGIIRDLTESGIAVQAVTPLQTGDEVPIHFELFSPRVRVEAQGRVAWADQSGQAGVSFIDLPERTRRGVRDWILIQMFSSAAVSGRDSIFMTGESQLVLSPAGRPAIAIPDTRASAIVWGLLSFSVSGFAVAVDSLVLICAVLLFSVAAIAVMGGVPPLVLSLALLFAAGSIFVAAYQLIFSDFLCGASPGKRLAKEAAGVRRDEFLLTRFR